MTLSENKAPTSHQAAFLDTPDDAAKWLATITSTPELAVDTEGASFHRFVDRVYLLQLSTRDANGIIDPLAVPAPAELGRLLESQDVEIVFHDADYDLRLLRQDYGWRVRRIFDTRVAAQLLGIKSFGLAALLERYFGVKLEKKFQRADWSMRPLTQGMLDYAVQDTVYLLDLRDKMRDELELAGRIEWAREEFERLELTQWSEAEDADAFLRIKGARDLTRRELALFRELVKWRDEVAGEMDRATFRVVGNDTLLEAARTVPRSASELTAVKGMPRALVDRKGGDMIAAIDRGLAVPEADLPRFPRAARWDRDPDFDENVNRLKAIRDAVATRLELDPGVLCSRERLELIARRKPRTVDDLGEIEGLRRWQIGLLGEEMVHALSPYR